MKIEVNEEAGIPRKSQPEIKLEMEFSTSAMKSTVDGFTDQTDRRKHRISGLKDKLEELNHSTKGNGKIKF